MVLFHSSFSGVAAFGLYLLRPSMFPSLMDGKIKALPASLVLKGVIPVGVLFSIQLVLNNTAYLHSSVAFLQMIKECNIVSVYIVSLMVGLEVFHWRSVVLMVGVLCATSFTI